MNRIINALVDAEIASSDVVDEGSVLRVANELRMADLQALARNASRRTFSTRSRQRDASGLPLLIPTFVRENEDGILYVPSEFSRTKIAAATPEQLRVYARLRDQMVAMDAAAATRVDVAAEVRALQQEITRREGRS